MRRIIYPTMLTVLLFACSKNKEWRTYDYTKFNFRVDLPYEPELRINSDLGDGLTYNQIISKSPEEAPWFTSYSVFYVDLENSMSSTDSSYVLQYFKVLDDQARTLNNPVRIISQKEFRQFGYPGKEYVKEFADGNQIEVSRFILVDNKSYQLDLIYPTNKKDNPEHKKFIESFRLVTN